MAKGAMEECGLDLVLMIPSCVSYLKAGMGVSDAVVRLEMLKLALEDEERLIADDLEIRRGGNSYTCDTIRELSKEYGKECLLCYIIGDDTLLSMHRWKEPEVIFEGCRILTIMREHEKTSPEVTAQLEFLQKEYRADIKLLDVPVMDISSTMIRNRVKDGLDLYHLVPLRVAEYIRENKMYL
jgi:nicotinate-nucleotide adenylyltransferase